MGLLGSYKSYILIMRWPNGDINNHLINFLKNFQDGAG